MKNKAITHILYLEIQDKINWCDDKATIYTIMYYAARILLIVFATLITLFTGFEQINNSDYNKVVLWLGALTTILTALDTLYQPDTKRNIYKTMLHEYRVLRTEFVYNHHKYTLTPEIQEKLYQELKRIEAMGRDLIGGEKE